MGEVVVVVVVGKEGGGVREEARACAMKSIPGFCSVSAPSKHLK